MTRHFNVLLSLLLCLLAGASQASGLDALSNKDASGGLKEALNTGARYAVQALGQPDGFLGNDKVRIPLPESLQKVEKGLRTFGMGKQADELVTTMNRAAEQAVAGATPILLDAVKRMTVADAKDILSGGEDSVTQYFRRNTSEALTQKFMPIVQAATRKVQLGAQYNKFAGRAADFGLIDKRDADLDSYVTREALDGLYLMIAEKEKELRANPLQAGSALLRKVFGAL